jgi:hypothetical protein
MQMKTRYIVFPFAMFMLVCLLATSASGAGIKERMKERLPVIVSLKSQGVIGENNKGFLEYRTSRRPQETVVNAENKDRSLVYAAIARKQNVSPVIVGQRRALQIARKADPGEWLQDPSGKWYRK